MKSSEYPPIFEATRGSIVESTHFGAFAVVNNLGDLLASHGDPESTTYLRSSAKPFQALPFIEQGGDSHFGLTEAEIAVICASHSGTDEHVAVVRSMQSKLGIIEGLLQCGTHHPGDKETWLAMQKRGEAPLPVRHMCSGKHTGMLGYAKMTGASLSDYLSKDHPVQQAILKALAEMASYPVDQMVIGTDGCSAPNFALPLRNAALAMARLCQPERLHPKRASACQRITTAMLGQPGMVAGPRKLDTELISNTHRKVIAKGGAEGYQILGVMPDAIAPGSPALGIAIKIADGDADSRARGLVSYEILRQLGALTIVEMQSLQKYGPRRIFNFAKLDVGEYRPAFTIK